MGLRDRLQAAALELVGSHKVRDVRLGLGYTAVALDQCREVVMLGTSTPMSKAVFADTPVTLLSGIVVNDATGVLQAVSEAGGTPAIRAYTNKVNLRVCS